MKKIFSIILLFILLINNVIAFNPSKNDEILVESLEKRIDKLIEKKWENSRELLVKKLSSLKSDIKDNDRLVYILWELIDHIWNWIWEIEKIINELESSSWIYQDTHQWEYLLYTEYLSTYNKYIDSFVIWNWSWITWWCGSYGWKWEDVFKEQFEEYYEIAENHRDYLLMDLIKYDIEKFQTHFKKVCGWNWYLDNINFDQIDNTKKLNKINTSYYLHIYLFYNEWYRNVYNLLQDSSGSWPTCTVIQDDWNRFTKDRIDFFKSYAQKTNSTIYYNKFNKFPKKFKDMLKEECDSIMLD